MGFPCRRVFLLQKSERGFYKTPSLLFGNDSGVQAILVMRMDTNKGFLKNLSGLSLPFHEELRF